MVKKIFILKDVKPGPGVVKRRVLVPDKGKPGLTPKGQQWASFAGTMHGWSKEGSDSDRRMALMRSVRSEGVNTTKKKLVQLANITTDKDTKSTAWRDFHWMRIRFPPKSK